MNNQLTLMIAIQLSGIIGKDFDGKTASFRVHASLIYKLTAEVTCADEITALSELIKNAYDADALFAHFPLVQITLKKSTVKSAGCIELSDNGCGMDLTCIVNG